MSINPEKRTDLEDLISKSMHANRPWKLGIVGIAIDGQQVVRVPNEPSKIYVRLSDSSVQKVICKSMSPSFGTEVIIELNSRNHWEVTALPEWSSDPILENTDGNPYVGEHVHTLADIAQIGDYTPTAGHVFLGDGDSWESTQLEAALDTVVTGDATGYVKKTAAGQYVIQSLTEANFDVILTDSDGNVLSDSDGNVLIES